MAYPTVTTHPKLYPYTSIMASPYNGDPTGVVDCAAGIEALKANYSNVITIHIPKGTFLVDTDLVIPVGVCLDFAAGAKFSVGAGKTLTIRGSIICPPGQSCFTGSGIVSLGTTFSAASSEFLLRPGTWTISANTTIPANIHLKIERGAVFFITNGFQLTINGSFECGLFQCFDDDNTTLDGVVFGDGAVQEVNPIWWGAVGDESTDCTAAINAATNSLVTHGGIVRFPVGIYMIASTVYHKNSIHWIGAGRSFTQIKAAESFIASVAYEVATDDVQPMVVMGTIGETDAIGNTIRDMTIHCNIVADISAIYSDNIQENSGLERCAIVYTKFGMYLRGDVTPLPNRHPMHTHINDIEFYAGVGADVNSVGLLAQFGGQFYIDRVTCNSIDGGPAQVAAGIWITGGCFANVTNYHAENAVAGLKLGDAAGGRGYASGFVGLNISGTTGVTYLVKVEEQANNLFIANIIADGSTHTYYDAARSLDYTDTHIPLITKGKNYFTSATSYQQFVGAAGIAITAGTYDSGNLAIGANRIWRDANGFLKVRNGTVSADTDGSAFDVHVAATVQTTDATTTALIVQALPTYTACLVEARISGATTGVAKSSAYVIRARVYRIASTAVIAGTTKDFSNEEDAATEATIDVDGNNVRVLVTGIAAETWNWRGELKILPNTGSIIEK